MNVKLYNIAIPAVSHLVILLTFIVAASILSPDLLVSSNLIHWDAEHYFNIKERGYEGFNIAFFPLFPMVWKFIGFGNFGISIFNYLTFLVSIFALSFNFNFDKKLNFLLFSIPSLLFFYLPYSESLFFLSGVFILIGLQRNMMMLSLLGLLIASFSRPSVIFIFPAIVLTEILSPNHIRFKVKNILIYSLVPIVGLISIAIYHYYIADNFLAYFEVSRGWGGVFHPLTLPLRSWSGGLITRLDGTALLFGILSVISMTQIFIQTKSHRTEKHVLFSHVFVVSLTLFILMRGGDLFSLNRLLFLTPYFFIVVKYWYSSSIRFKNQDFILIFVIISLYWLLFNSYVHISYLLKFEALTAILLLVFGIKHKNTAIQNLSIVALIIISLTFQSLFLVRFLRGEWVA